MVPSLSSSCLEVSRCRIRSRSAGSTTTAIKVGSMLLTLVDPNRGFEVAYNRWYERDHFYAGCMIGPFLFAGQPLGGDARAEGRAVAHRRRDRSRRRPMRARTSRSTGSRRATTRTTSTFGRATRCASSTPRVADSPSASTRTPCSTTTSARLPRLRRRRGAGRARARPRLRRTRHRLARRTRGPRRARRSTTSSRTRMRPSCSAGSSIEIVSSWTPSAGRTIHRDVPMDLGSKAGGPERLCQLLVRVRRRAGLAAGDPPLHRRDRGRRSRDRAPRRTVLPHRRRHRHVRRRALVTAQANSLR